MWVLVSIWIVVLAIGASIKIVPLLRRGRVVVLDRPAPCSMAEAQRALDRLVAAGIHAEIVEGRNHGMTTWTNAHMTGKAGPAEAYVIQVPRKQAKAAAMV